MRSAAVPSSFQAQLLLVAFQIFAPFSVPRRHVPKMGDESVTSRQCFFESYIELLFISRLLKTHLMTFELASCGGTRGLWRGSAKSYLLCQWRRCHCHSIWRHVTWMNRALILLMLRNRVRFNISNLGHGDV